MEMVRLVEAAPYRSMSVNRLAQQLGVNRRTVRRWAKGLEGSPGIDGEPLVQLVPGTPGSEAMVERPKVSGTFTPADLRALALGLASTRYLAATGAKELEELAESLMSRLGRHDAEARARLAHAFHYIPFGAKNYMAKHDEVDAVFSGVLFRWTLDFDYLLIEGQRTIRVRAEPWSMVFYRDALYMLGRRMSYGSPVLRTYAIDRMSAATTDKKASFAVPEDFDPAGHFGDLGLWKPEGRREELEVLFSAEVAPLVSERDWPRTLNWGEIDDGRFRLVLDVRISPEVESWVLGYGASAEVTRPAWLREKMARQAADLAEQYARP